MSDVVKFTEDCQDFNRRLYAKQFELARMVEERGIYLDTARANGVMVSAASKMLGKLTFNITMPEGYQPPADPAGGQQDEAAE
jgi:hypothetical protein